MKRIIIMFLIIGLIFTIIGLIFSLFSKNINNINHRNISFSNSNPNKFLFSRPNLVENIDLTTSSSKTLIDIYFELNQKLENDFNNIKKHIVVDQKKTIEDYNQELEGLQKKFLNKLQQGFSEIFFFELANNLSQINPPPSLLEFHLNLIKRIYAIGLAMEQIKNTNDIFNKNLLYNFINDNLKQLLPQ